MTQASDAGADKIDVAHLMFSYDIGGKERVLADIMAARSGGPVQYAVFVVNDSYNEGLIGRLRAAGARVFLLGRKGGSRSVAPFLEYFRLIRKHRIDIVHTRSLSAIPLAVAARLLRPELRLFGSVHNTGVMTKAKSWHIAFIKRFYEKVVAISKAVKAECEAKGLEGVVVMNNAIDVARFSAPARIAPYTQGSRPFRIICVARYLLAQKAQDVLLEAVARCRQQGLNVTCQLLGNLDGRNEKDFAFLKELVARLALEASVEFVTNQTNVQDYLAQADLFVLPSRFEGFGNVVLEAMAAGTPVVVSDVDGLAEIVTDGVNGRLVAPEDVAGLAGMIAWAEGHPGEIQALAAKARIDADRYDIGAYALAYEQLYLAAIQRD